MVVEVPGHQHVAIHPPCRPPAEGEREREMEVYTIGERKEKERRLKFQAIVRLNGNK